MGELPPTLTDPESVKQLYKDVINALRKPHGVRRKTEGELHAMLESTLGKQQAASVFEKIQQRLQQERPFLSIEKEPAKNIAIALGEQSEAVIALVLAHLEPSLSAEVLRSLETGRGYDVVKRMASLVPPAFEVLVAISIELSARLKEIADGPVVSEPSQRRRTIAEMLTFSPAEVEKAVLESLDKDNADMAKEIREYMFTWEDLAKVEKRPMQKILTSVDTRTLAIALKACSVKVEANVMSNLSERVRQMIADERELAGAMAMSEVQAARGEIMKSVRALMESGEFRPSRAGEELVT
jgi:flagellar motor switch protein FliG